MMFLDLLSRPMPRLLNTQRDAASAIAIDGPSAGGLRLVDVSTPSVKSRASTKRLARKSEAIGGSAYVLHPEPETRAQFDTVLRGLGLSAVVFEDAASLSDALAVDSPEIVLWGLPGCTPDDLESLRSVTMGSSLPIVVVGTLGDEITTEDVQDAGACDLIVLPLPCHRLAPALSVAMLRHEIMEILAEDHDGLDDRRAARNLAWRAARVWAKRRGMTEAEALRYLLSRTRSRGQTITRTAMEVVAEGLFP